MKKFIIHLSDLHFRNNWEEDQGLVLDAFFKDLSILIKQIELDSIYIAFSGDVVYTGLDKELYSNFLAQFDSELSKVGIKKNHRICIPGNHDVSVKYIEENDLEHYGIVSQKINEKEFNDFISRQPKILINKFANYSMFETKFADYGVSPNVLSGAGWNIDDDIGIYCLNTAICSSGGFKKINDRYQLSVDTRSLQKWLLESKTSSKILIMHHPIEWLTDWAREHLKIVMRKHFNLCLYGHLHEQSYYHIISPDYPLVECSAPPLLTDKNGKLGYSIITVSKQGVHEIQYRQWTRNKTFRAGVDFSDTEDGKIIIIKEYQVNNIDKDYIFKNKLNTRLETALKAFRSQPIIWIDPVLSKTNDLAQNADDETDYSVDLNEMIKNPKNTIIKAPPQFGLTCLAHYMVKEAYRASSSIWLYLDVTEIKSSHRLDKVIKQEIQSIGINGSELKCIILDSWKNIDKDSINMLKAACSYNVDIPIIVMNTIDDSSFIFSTRKETIGREFETVHLLALTRSRVRKVVSIYNREKHIGDEDTVIGKIVKDIEVLNIHRTPLNCLTMLKISEKYFDESPVNRTKMLEMILFLLFNMDGIPKYKTKPDLKDCEYVLGYFCERMLKTANIYFSREQFQKEIKSLCEEKLINLEVDVVFDVLYENCIIVSRGLLYCFRYSYWIYYFAAQRMHHDKNFADYMFDEKRYASYPEIIEFYTGIDRRREDALQILLKDIKSTCDIVESKVGLPSEINIYNIIKWTPTNDMLEKMQSEINENVQNSKLPDSIKDQYADQGYNQLRPYDQNIYTILSDYSFLVLGNTMKAASRALRNSDYADPAIKRSLLSEIMRSWGQFNNILVALTPVLAAEGKATFEGAKFILSNQFSSDIKTRIFEVLHEIPSNVLRWNKDDLFSYKMSSLLYEQLKNEKNDLLRHQLILLIIVERPQNWRSHVEEYITLCATDSFYLAGVVEALRSQYRFSFATQKELREMTHLIKMGIAKHMYNVKKPGLDIIGKVNNKNIPTRQVDGIK